MTQSQAEEAARTMADSFLEYPLNKAIFGDIPKAREVMVTSSLMNIREFERQGSIHLLDGSPKGMVLGYVSNEVRPLMKTLHKVRIYLKMSKLLSKEDTRLLKSRFKAHSKVMDFKWPKRHLSVPYYYVKVVALDSSLRGSGAFRRLITPVIEEFNTRNLPMVLETHDERVAQIYGHFGFETVEVIEAEGLTLKQHCMVRWPDGTSR